MKKFSVPLVLLAVCAVAGAKLPPPDEATKAKAEETAARAAWQGKVDQYLLCKAQDKVAAYYRKTAAKPAVVDSRQVSITSATLPGSGPAAAASAVAKAPATAAQPAAAVQGATPPQAAASGTPVASTPTPLNCADPGPFAYNKPEQKPLEASGAHSPAGTAASPPSVKPNSAEMAPAKK